MAFNQLPFNRNAIIWGSWDCQWPGEANNIRIHSKIIIVIQTTDLGKLSTIDWFLSRYDSLKSSSWIPLSSSNTWIQRIICHCATCSWVNLDHISAIFLENILLESVANLTLFWPSAATIGRAQRIFQEIWVMPESLRQGASHATHLFGTRKYLTCGKSPHMYSSPESKRQCREFGDVICFRGCARHRLNQEQFVHAIRDRKQSLSASDNDLFFTWGVF